MNVYIITAVSDSGSYMPPVKVGISRDPARRLKELNSTACPYQLSIYRTIEVDDDLAKQIEREFHGWARREHTVREWFDITPEEATDCLEGCLFSAFRLRGKIAKDARLRAQQLIYGED